MAVDRAALTDGSHPRFGSYMLGGKHGRAEALSANEIAFFEAALERVREMRANMEGLAEVLDKAGLTGLSFDTWRGKLVDVEHQLQTKIDRLRNAHRT